MAINGKKPSKFEDVLDSDTLKDKILQLKSGSVNVIQVSIDSNSEAIWDIEAKWDDDAGKGNKDNFRLEPFS